VLLGVDRESVIHDVFLHLMSDDHARQSFRGGSFRAWLSTLSRNRAVDFARRRKLEVPVGMEPPEAPDAALHEEQLETEARLVIDEFRRRVLPPKWERVFEARFLRQLDQPTAARELGMRRTTLAYQEYRIRALLRRFVLGRPVRSG
jgi:RNA polymerase sigma-70 factor (ECF subfamily)